MKSRLLFCLVWFLSGTLFPFLCRAYDILPIQLDGSMMPYDFAATQKCVWPDSLRPVHVSYIARHGARYMTGPAKFTALEKTLKDAKSAGDITEDGLAFLAMIDTIRSVSDGKWGQLSPVGIGEEERLGKEMSEMFTGLHDGYAKVAGIASFVPRAIMTMYEFNHALALGNDSLDISAESGHQFSDLLYFFAVDSVYSEYRKSGAWKRLISSMESKNLSPEPIEKLIGKRMVQKIGRKHALKLVTEIYSVLQSRRAMGLSAPTTRWMNEREYRSCWYLSNLTHYLRNCVNPLAPEIVKEAVKPLVIAILDDIEDSQAHPQHHPFFDGYFGHAETLLPLLSALRIPGCHYNRTDYTQLYRVWQLQNITPLGANLAIILLESDTHNLYASVRLNGRNVKPIPGKGYIVSWSELSDYWKSGFAE